MKPATYDSEAPGVPPLYVDEVSPIQSLDPVLVSGLAAACMLSRMGISESSTVTE